MICANTHLTVQRKEVKNGGLKLKDEPEEGNGCLESWHGMPGFLQMRRLCA
ncbi:hypothetical protein DPMN_025196 [Dreissena polymorpha]|uniref:Uncharacterized protein n=1 Tax=Dreissena polymorpha TaxID=45954 RepID=A0A9D4RDE6_DREPO|nr:hypothetical protein DPMN_025196 [Dreissena polymorpha]